MGKRSRRRKGTNPEVTLIDAKRLFSEELNRLMVEAGFSVERYGYDACEAVIRECVNRAYWQAWDEFMDWVETGDAAGSEVMAALRESMGMSTYVKTSGLVTWRGQVAAR